MLNFLFQDDMQDDDIDDNPDSSSDDDDSTSDDGLSATQTTPRPSATFQMYPWGLMRHSKSQHQYWKSTYVLCKICRFELNKFKMNSTWHPKTKNGYF